MTIVAPPDRSAVSSASSSSVITCFPANRLGTAEPASADGRDLQGQSSFRAICTNSSYQSPIRL